MHRKQNHPTLNFVSKKAYFNQRIIKTTSTIQVK